MSFVKGWLTWRCDQ